MKVVLLVLTALLAPLVQGFVVTNPRRLPTTSLYYKSEDPDDDSYHKGGNARYQTPLVQPSLFDEDEECEHVMVDFVTGDELCWNEAPEHPRNVVAQSSSSAVETRTVPPSVAEDAHKGGNARYKAVGRPSKLMDDEDCETPFIDFATGDELCWNDYDKSSP